MAIVVTLLVWALEIVCLLQSVAAIKQHICPGAKQMEIPVLLLAIGIPCDVACNIALHKPGLVRHIKVPIIIPAP